MRHTRYDEITQAVLGLIDQESIAGTTIPAEYNNQADALKKIPFLINSAVMDIRVSVRPRRAVLPVAQDGGGNPDESSPGGDIWAAIQLPKDCRRVISGGIRAVGASGPVPTNDYRFYGDGQIWFPPGHYLVEYEQYPPQLPTAPADSYEFAEDPDVIHAAIFYAAAHLVRQDSEYDYATLMNEYEDRKARLVPQPYAEIVPIQDVYGF